MRVVLFHNEDAGDGSSVDEITALFERHGHHLVQVVDKEHRVERILASHAELAVAAGGDGTVATAARVLAGHKLPLAILPLGTANNIAKSLSSDGPLDTLVEAWGRTKPQSLDIGFARAEWGQRIFFESVGAGLIPAGIAAAKALEDGDQTTSARWRRWLVMPGRDPAAAASLAPDRPTQRLAARENGDEYNAALPWPIPRRGSRSK